ncbi:MAG: hypothetical protein H7177_05535 [Rhizobacter sp.]|nr:hypothetical protein [Bacteriovorax sp.]
MKFLIFSMIAVLVSLPVFSKEPVKKNIMVTGHVSKLKPSKGHYYWFSMHESSTAYYADEKFVPCLEKSMTDNKVVNLTLNPTLVVLKCGISK